MNFKNTLITAVSAFKAHKVRAALTILGIVIGVAAIIIVMSIGSGAQKLILDQISGLGAETVIVRPGEGIGNIPGTLLAQSLTEDDVEALRRRSNVPNLVSASPFVLISGSVEYEGETYNPSIFGGSVEFMSDVFSVYPAEGRLFTDAEIESNARVAVIGSELRDEIFENRRAIGEDIQIENKKFEIVGVFEEKTGVVGFDFNELVMVPHTSAQTYITGSDYYHEVIIRADDVDNVEKVVFDVTATLRDTHDIRAGDEDDFHIQTQEDAIGMIESIVSILTAFLSMVVAISLIVGGIGIMNIMLVSVTERTKEIGLRKALGARRADILRQFLLEAIILTSIGGIVGIIFGSLISYGASIVLAQTVDPNWDFVFPVSAAVLGVGVSAVVGLIFGIYPASKASKKSPIEALRYE